MDSERIGVYGPGSLVFGNERKQKVRQKIEINFKKRFSVNRLPQLQLEMEVEEGGAVAG